MCDEGEKTCPLCAEEMDLTDQQLKPCKCGYEVCVWCWHHIMEMSEKDGTEGRCPACRTPYDKEKIVTASKCERLVAEINMEKKIKSQKTKAKVTEGRKQLSSVRVIQRNLVYIVGLPLNLADEDILQTKEYFGQYGKVLKVSMSRTAAGVIQQLPNNTCSVYITYAKEEEAIRCIQSVHGFTLEDRQLRACFGTTKYCHAWLRSVPCNNPDCLYLHEIGSQEDSFTKDEIISAYTRVEQITATTNTLQKRSGTVLPPPVDNYCNGSSATAGKPIVKIPSNSAASIVRGSPPTGSASRSMALPAAASWGTRGLNCSSQSSNAECPNGSSKSKFDPNGSIKTKLDSASRTSMSAGSSATEPSNLHGNVVKRGHSLKDGNQNILANVKVDTSHNLDTSLSDNYYEQDGPTASRDKRRLSPNKDKVSEKSSGSSMEVSSTTGNAEAKVNIPNERNINNLCGDMSSFSINRNLHPEPGAERPDTLASDPHFIGSSKNQGIQQQLCDDQHEESQASVELQRKVDPSVAEVCGKTDKFASMLSEVEEDILSFDSQRLKDPEVVSHSSYLPSLTSPQHLSNQFTSNSSQHPNVFVDRRTNDSSFLHQAPPGLPNGHVGNSQSSSILQRRTESSFFPSNELQGRHTGMHVDATYSERNGRLDAGESNIISNILSMDFDPWNDSLTSPHHLAKMFGNADRQHGSVGSNHWKGQNNSQSRFSFARQEDSVSQPSNYQSFTGFEQQIQRNNGFEQHIQRNNGFNQQIQRNNGFEQQIQRNKSIDDDQDLFFQNLGISNGFPSRNSLEPSNMAPFAASRTSVPTPRSQISAPPGFSLLSKAPPPGFATTERAEHDSFSGNHHRMPEMPPVMLRNGSEAQMMNGNITAADIEFMDPAILAVGKGRPQSNSGYDIRSFQQQHNMRQPFENDSRLDLLTHQSSSSFSSHPNHHQLGGYDMGAAAAAGYPLSDSSRVLDQRSPLGNLPFAAQLSFQQQQQQQQGRNAGVVSNGHWNGGWNDLQSGNNGMVMAELLRNERERLGINKQQQQLYSNGFEDTKYRMPSSGDHLYNRTFGM